MKSSVIKLKNPVGFASCACVAGTKEHAGPFGDKFDICADDSFGQKTWEQSEAESQRLALERAMTKGGYSDGDIGALFCGDLINQCTPSAQGLLGFDIPHIGLYGACSTAVLGIGLAALTVASGYFARCAAVTSSHNLTAERQFRYPVEYGALRTPTSQWTVTGAGAFILEKGSAKTSVREFLPGRTVEMGITDANNMGAAMAPAALDTILRYFDETGTKPLDYDKIITGDLGQQGYEILCEQAEKHGVDLNPVLTDCGLLIYDREKQNVQAGGSGCACSALMLAGHFLRELENGVLNNILFIGTGALLSPLSVAQGDAIPGVAHLIRITGERQNADIS